MSQENVERVRSSLDAWNRGDVDAWLRSAHPEIEWFSEVARRLEGSETVYLGRQQRPIRIRPAAPGLAVV
jgi:ketosteroid isomerase-like protein